MTNSIDIYEAWPLIPSSRTIRLLQIQRDQDDRICGSFRVHSLDDQNGFWIALSYTWRSFNQADDEKMHDISIEGAPFAIGTNLLRALNALLDQRREDVVHDDIQPSSICETWACERPVMNEHTCFWIDAICINQSNIQERNHQVALMGAIYSRANLVISWMTPGDNYAQSSQSAGWTLEELCERDYLDATAVRVVYNVYWERMWIIQECVLPRVNVLLFEHFWIDPHKIDSWTRSRNGRMAAVVNTRISFQSPPVTSNERTPTLLSMITRFLRHKCADPRDRIYALLGLKVQYHPIEVNYEKSNLELFIEFVVAEVDFVPALSGRSRTILEVALALGLEDTLPVVDCLSRLPYSSFTTIPWHNDMSTSQTWTDWLSKSSDGWKSLQAFAASCQFGRSESGIYKESGPFSFDGAWTFNRACKSWISLEEFCEERGICIDQLCVTSGDTNPHGLDVISELEQRDTDRVRSAAAAYDRRMADRWQESHKESV